jgi:hypothetical protein
MNHETIALDDVGHVTDHELIAGLRHLVRADQTLRAQLLVHIGEVDARGLYREHAHSSMFTYCMEELRMSEAQAYSRIQAARRKFPRVLQLVAQGELHLTAIKLVGPHLTPDNHEQLLEQVRRKGKREVELLVARLAPKRDVPNRIRKLPEPSSPPITRASPTSAEAKQDASAVEASVSAALGDASKAPEAAAVRDPNRAAFALEAPPTRGSTTPLSPGRYKVEFTAGQALRDKLAQLQDLLRHQVPDGELAVIIERAVDLLIDQSMKQRFARTRAPKSSVWRTRARPSLARRTRATSHVQ